MIFDTLAGSRFTYATGTSGTVTVAAGKYVTSITAHAPSTGDGSLTITPGGPNQNATAGSAIVIPATCGFSDQFFGQLGPGTVLVFSGTDTYYVAFAQFTAGGP